MFQCKNVKYTHNNCIVIRSSYVNIQMAFRNQTIWHPTSFRPFKYQTSLVFRSPLWSCSHMTNWTCSNSSFGFERHLISMKFWRTKHLEFKCTFENLTLANRTCVQYWNNGLVQYQDLSWPLSLSRCFYLLRSAKGVFSPVSPYRGYLKPSHFFVILCIYLVSPY